VYLYIKTKNARETASHILAFVRGSLIKFSSVGV
jgi:hypothetical protein